MTFAQAILGFSVVALLLTLVPGIDSALIVRSAVSFSRRYAWMVALGILSGTLVWGIAAAVGATALLATSEIAYRLLSVAGALYLGWMGVRLCIRSFRQARGPEAPAADADGTGGIMPATAAHDSLWRGFALGLITNLLNPKVGVFYLAVIPQFMPPGMSPIMMGTALALVHNLWSLVWFAILIVAGNGLGKRLRSPKFLRWLDRVTGGVLVAFGIGLLFELRTT